MRARLKRAIPAKKRHATMRVDVRDGEAARQAGIDFGTVSWGYARPEALRRLSPVLVFDSVADILGIV